MPTPAGLVELMSHTALVWRSDGLVANQQDFLEIATLPCYVDTTKADQQPPAITAYFGVQTTAPVHQGDYIRLSGPIGDLPIMWMLGSVQTWWDEFGGYWCQQAALDCPTEVCTIEAPAATVPDDEARFTGWAPIFMMSAGVRPLSVSEQRRATQDGLQINLMMRYPPDMPIGRANRVVIESGGYKGTYEVLTIEQHPEALTAMLRNYDPAGTPV
jgi:hypothetical protein